MAYPFENAPTTFKGYLKSLKDLAYTDDPFDKGFQSRLPEGKAYAFDDIKNAVCVYRSAKAKQPLRSADGLLVIDDGKTANYILIDFKNQKPDNIQSVKDPDRNELMQKAFDSLSILAMTFCHKRAMCEIQQKATFIVVYPKCDYSIGFLNALSECAKNEPLWKLDKLVKSGFYADIKTIDDETFKALNLPFVKNDVSR